MEHFLRQLPFDLDDFQKQAIEVISKGHSVVVCAPTGSGKTIIAEYAAFDVTENGGRLFYTTPLKALSNQKFNDFRAQYGDDNVGLLTGDTSINRDARIVVMTTEVFRNMLYTLDAQGQGDPVLNQVRYLVLDECHYMNDPQRGTVWEETIIYCPESIQIIALSATIANSQELTNWINEVHHDTFLIESDFRPVPLRFSYYDREKVLPLLEAPGRLNNRLKSHGGKGNRFSKQNRQFRPNDLIREMAERDMLPAIIFTFSRKDCDRSLKATRDLNLLTPAERKTIKSQIHEFLREHPFLKDNPMLELIENGFASHHAGLLPGLKHLVEKLFQQGLIKAVFATETLAAGINMPARSTVITAISKRTDDGHRILTASEFLQMSGRAGRRGMDKVGYVVVVATPYQSAQDVGTLATSNADPLNSQFTPTYGMVVNLLQKHSLEEAHFLISKSFGQFTAERRIHPVKTETAEKTEQLKELLSFECPLSVSDEAFHSFLRSRDMLYDTNKFIQVLKKQVKKYGDAPEIVSELGREEAKKKNLEGTVNDSPCKTCSIIGKHRRIEDRVQRLQKSLKFLNRQLEREQDIYWKTFMRIYDLLKEADYVNEADKPTELGLRISELRTENEFFVSELIRSGTLDGLAPPQLAAVVCAIVTESTRDNLYSNLSHSAETQQAIVNIAHEMRRVRKLQGQHQVDVPLNLNPIASGLVEAWCQGLSWDRLEVTTNLAAGDLVRMMRRTADILRQLMRLTHVREDLTRTARVALDMLYRDPVKEPELVESMPETTSIKPEAALSEKSLPEKSSIEAE